MARFGRDRHLSRTRGAQQPARASPARGRAQAARSLRHLHGEPPAVRRVLRRGRAIGALLHLRQFVSDRAGELAYIVNNSLSKVLITSQAKRDVALAALADCPRVELCLIVDGPGEGTRVRNLDEATAEFPATPDRRRVARRGDALLVRHDRAGRRACCVRCPISRPPQPLSSLAARLNALAVSRGPDLSFARAALPFGAVGRRQRDDQARRDGHRHGTVRRGALPAARRAHRVTHTQLVPTMFSRMLKLPEDARRAYDLSSLEVAIHAAAPCPVPVKRAMIDWWGPIILEYYGATEGIGMTFCDSAEWLAHPGTVGKAVFGELHVLDDAMREVPAGRDRQALVQDRLAVRIFQRSGQDRRGEFARPHDEHGRRHRLCRRGGLRLSHRPRGVHDHLRRRQHLSAGMREPARHPSQGRRRRRVRRAQRGDGRGGQGGRATDAGLRDRGRRWRPS